MVSVTPMGVRVRRLARHGELGRTARAEGRQGTGYPPRGVAWESQEARQATKAPGKAREAGRPENGPRRGAQASQSRGRAPAGPADAGRESVPGHERPGREGVETEGFRMTVRAGGPPRRGARVAPPWTTPRRRGAPRKRPSWERAG